MEQCFHSFVPTERITNQVTFDECSKCGHTIRVPKRIVLMDPNTGEPTPVRVQVFADAVFIVHESGGTLVNIEVTVNGDGEQVVRTFVANPAVVIEDEEEGFFVIDTTVAAGGCSG